MALPNPRVRPERLEAAIKASPKSMTMIAEQAGCSRATIHQLLTGRRKGCTEELARGIAAALEVGVDDLFIFFVPAVSSNDDRQGVPS